jgi:hypothetical protein
MASRRRSTTKIVAKTPTSIAPSTPMGKKVVSKAVKPHAPFKLSLAICAGAQ